MRKKAEGFSLLELVIAMSVGSLVMAIALSSYTFSARNYHRQVRSLNGLSLRLTAIEILTQSIDSSGFAAFCDQRSNRLEILNMTTERRLLKPVIFGVSAKDTNQIIQLGLNKQGSGRYLPGNDILILQSVKQNFYQSLGAIDKGVDKLDLPKDWKLKPLDILSIASLDGSIYVGVKKIDLKDHNTVSVYLSEPLKSTIPKGSIASQVVEKIFYIGQTQRENDKGDKINALYVKYENRRYELISNIDKLHFKFLTKKIDDKEFNKISADKVTNWDQVKGIDVTVGSENGSSEALIAVKRQLG